MLDLEERLRNEILQQAEAYEPSPELARDITERIERRSQRNLVLTAAAVTIGVVGIAAGGVLATGGKGHDRVVVEGPDERTTSEAPATSTTTEPPPSTTTTTTTTTVDTGSTVGDGTTLSRHGIGPVRAGEMTVAEARAATGSDLSVEDEHWANFGRSCGVFTSPDRPVLFVAWTPDHMPTEDSGQAVVRAVGGDDPGIRTEEGIHPGSTLDDVHQAYGQPTRTVDAGSWVGGDDILLYDDDAGFSYGFRIRDGKVIQVLSGELTGPAEFEPCQ